MLRDGSWHPASPTTRARYAGHRRAFRHRLEHHRTGRNPRAGADRDIAEHLGARTDHHAVTDLRMAVAGFLAGPAKRHALQDRDIVADDGRRPNNQPGRMVEEEAAADGSGRRDICLENAGRAALQIKREILAALQPKPMRQTMRLDGMEALEIKDRLDERVQAGSRS